MSKSSCAMFKNLPRSATLKQKARLNLIAGTPETAYKLDPKYKKIELFLIQKSIHGPSIGLKKFWRNNLPTLKFHNEDVSFNMVRIKTEGKKDFVKVPTKILVHEEGGSTTEIDCANKQYQEILHMLVKATNATSVPMSEIPRLSNGQEEESYSI